MRNANNVEGVRKNVRDNPNLSVVLGNGILHMDKNEANFLLCELAMHMKKHLCIRKKITIRQCQYSKRSS